MDGRTNGLVMDERTEGHKNKPMHSITFFIVSRPGVLGGLGGYGAFRGIGGSGC